MKSYIQKLQDELTAWSYPTFGSGGPQASLQHMYEEVAELIKEPHDKMEFADVLLLLLDAYARIGGTADDLVIQSFMKLGECKARKWSDPDENGVVRHIKPIYNKDLPKQTVEAPIA